MIQIPRSIVEGIVLQARAELPNEACGLLAGKGAVAQRRYGMTNADASPEHFTFVPAEQFQVLRSARAEGLDIIANYHSHPVTPARPSEEDIKLAFDPNILYIIVSLASAEPVVKAFHIRQGIVENVLVEILEGN
jgi:[CysO sulfur-carrier protein]-S-L-cysteine hydrolase